MVDPDIMMITINVEQVDGGYAVFTRRDGEVWLTHGPFQHLEEANMQCQALVAHAERLSAQYRTIH